MFHASGASPSAQGFVLSGGWLSKQLLEEAKYSFVYGQYIAADILGDWREELITVLPGELRIYTTTIPASDRCICLMQDPVYRAEVAHRPWGTSNRQ